MYMPFSRLCLSLFFGTDLDPYPIPQYNLKSIPSIQLFSFHFYFLLGRVKSTQVVYASSTVEIRSFKCLTIYIITCVNQISPLLTQQMFSQI